MSFNFISLEAFFANTAFASLFLGMLMYWIQVGFVWQKGKLASLFMGVANVALVAFLVLRWYDSGHFPLSNLYESLLFLSWSLTTLHFVIEFTFKQPLLSAITAPMALFTNAFAALSLPAEMKVAGPLVPALQSNWLMMHVTVMILSYAALIGGSLLSIAFLILARNLPDTLFTQTTEVDLANSSAELGTNSALALNMTDSALKAQSSNVVKLAQKLDNLSYRVLGLGFPLLTIGILSGAVWANEAWGSYWSWDPKETWALLTWLVFAIYLHTRLTKGWQGKKPAMIAALGFLTVWVCFLGVNLIGEGLHSYGFATRG
uniref:Cytochrome c biogenesis protein CcsA n=1 Tax=Mychonastes homosphaera TaxID=31300 RepID=A0A140H9U4_MYCHS|nr:heme attachment to plastid cytochrome c [Mychonastes homosphaera]AMO00943.1 heme attachment to plastid cytochrome c [Mychonastes homosphaera]